MREKTTERNSIRTIKKWMTFWSLAVIVTAWILAPVTQANAESRNLKIKNQITRFEYIPILDNPGHIVGIFERQGEVEFEDGEKATQILRGTIDINSGKGTFQGYSLFAFEDGSTTIAKVEGTLGIPPGEKLPVSHVKGKYIKGSGRYQGIEGTVALECKQVKPYGGEHKADMEIEGTVEYALPRK